MSNGVNTGLTVLDNTAGGVILPVSAEAVIKRQMDLEVYLKSFVRTGGLGKLQRDGNVYYSIFAKADLDRDITVDSDGKVVTGGMYGAESDSSFGYVKPTTVKAYTDSVSLVGGKFMKELITQRELELENLPTLASDRISTYQNGNEELIIHDIKSAIVASIGATGKAATDAGWSVTETREIEKDYTVDEAGGLDIYNDIDTSLTNLLNIGRKGTSEEKYPFARGRGLSDITVGISRKVNRALTIAFKESPSGTFPGITVDVTKGNVTNLFGTSVVVMDGMPNKVRPGGTDAFAFNWVLLVKGESGAIAMPSVFGTNFLIRPHYEGVSSLAKIIEGSGGSWGIKFFQPELVFGSTTNTAV